MFALVLHMANSSNQTVKKTGCFSIISMFRDTPRLRVRPCGMQQVAQHILGADGCAPQCVHRELRGMLLRG